MPGVVARHPTGLALSVLLAVTFGVPIFAGLVTSWVVVLSNAGVARAARRRATALLLASVVLCAAFWLTAFTWHGPGYRPDPDSPTGFDRPPWITAHLSVTVALAGLVVSVLLVACALRLRRPRS